MQYVYNTDPKPVAQFGGAVLAGLIAGLARHAEVRISPTVTAGSYTAHDCLGGVMVLPSASRIDGGGGRITGIAMIAQDDGATDWTANDVEVLIFNSEPDGDYGDNDPLATTGFIDADADKLIASVPLPTKTSLGDLSRLAATGLDLPYACRGGTALYAVAVNRGGRTPDAADGIQFVFDLDRAL